MPTKRKTTVRFITLGCPKNLVDTEVMGGLVSEEFSVVPEGEASDVGIVNTCGFIEASKKESLDAILNLAREKKEGRLKLLIVAGCLSQRYATELPKLLPEVDAFVGTGDFSRVPEVIREKLAGVKKRNFILDPTQELHTASSPRLAGTPAYSRYIKISEGCSHACSFCTIPLMRGGLKSRPQDDVLDEIRRGASEGTKEFNLIAQDLNEYGRDLADRGSLYGLLGKLAAVEGDFWVRLLYMYPLQFPDRLIRLMKDHPHVVPYVDIPLQHIDDRILKSMNRGSSSAYIYRLIEKLKKEIP
ncbi:MAG: MiaB/RimO family radical SAM methylthiotransferase, partial [Deltaproteobacteria bacterium]|nr:MiaB/RimO family radical SAM methylthiotransferase [Deltaproteobacteria bacterium]